MYYIRKTLEISAAHRLSLSYESKCASLHGHNWILTIFCRSPRLNADGMVVDFTKIKEFIMSKLDHKVLNDELDFNPTAENIAKWIVDSIDTCYRCEILESSGNMAAYELDD